MFGDVQGDPEATTTAKDTAANSPLENVESSLKAPRQKAIRPPSKAAQPDSHNHCAWECMGSLGIGMTMQHRRVPASAHPAALTAAEPSTYSYRQLCMPLL